MKKRLNFKKEFPIPDPEETWAIVELYRWQHGTLPMGPDQKPLELSKAVRGMAKAFEKDSTEWPAPFNVASVLNYLANKLEKHKIHP